MTSTNLSGPAVLFVSGGAAFALPHDAVRALLPLPRLDAPPGLPPPLAGFMNLGGEAVPVLDLARLLDAAPGEPHPYRHLILLAGEQARALLVDRVLDVLPAGPPLRPVERAHSINGLVTGALEVEGVTAHLLDPARLLLEEEAAVLGALTAQARARLARWTGGAASPGSGAPP